MLDHLTVASIAMQAAVRDLGFVVDGSCELVAAARAIVDLADIVCTRTVAALDPVAVRDLGYPSVSDWMAANTNAGPSEGARRVAHAKLLAKLPLWSDAVDAGTIGCEQVRVLASRMRQNRLKYAVRDEAVLLDIASTLTVADFVKAMDSWVARCDDTLTAPNSEDDSEAERRLSLSQLANGDWHIEGLLNAMTGAAMSAAFDSVMAKPGVDEDRTTTQRRHDALYDIAMEILGNDGRADVHGQRPNVTVIVDAKSGLAYLEQRIYLSSVTRDMVLCDSVTTSIWLKPNGAPFDVGTPESVIPARNRRAVLARDCGCRMPGCGRRARWSDIHHIKHREHGGTHELENLVTLCRFHHRYVHRKSLSLYWDADGVTLMVEWPNGTLKHAPPTLYLAA